MSAQEVTQEFKLNLLPAADMLKLVKQRKREEDEEERKREEAERKKEEAFISRFAKTIQAIHDEMKKKRSSRGDGEMMIKDAEYRLLDAMFGINGMAVDPRVRAILESVESSGYEVNYLQNPEGYLEVSMHLLAPKKK